MNPICRHCTKAARTVDTPNVKVRVDSCLVFRADGVLRIIVRCHGEVIDRPLTSFARTEPWDEKAISALEVFRGS